MWDFSNPKADGICKKILSEISAFEKQGFEVDYTYIRNGDFYLKKDGEERKVASYNPVWNKLFANRELNRILRINKYKAVYYRYACTDFYFIKCLKSVKKNNGKNIIEIPTYPYDQEISVDIKGKTFLLIDKIHRKNLKKYVDRIVTYSNDKKIFGINTIHIVNGIDFANVKLRKTKAESNTINIIAVASMVKWQGYDRFLIGLGKYSQLSQKKKIKLHLVGDGPEIDSYKKIAKQYNIQNNIVFYGKKFGEELDKIYDNCDLALAPLGMHRKDIYISSALKTREYAAKGLPIITSTPIDVFPEEKCDFIYKISEDEQSVDMKEIIQFYNKIYQGKTHQCVANDIRKYAEKVCDMSYTMKPIIEYCKNILNNVDLN